MLDDDKFLRQTIEYLSEEQTSKESFTECFHVLTLLHPPLICVFSDLSPGLQEDIRGGLLNIVLALHTDLRCVGALALIIREIIEMDSL